jgi:hypothetical protein
MASKASLTLVGANLKFIISETVTAAKSEDYKQYQDFVDEFDAIGDVIDPIPCTHPVHVGWMALNVSMYSTKGDLDSCTFELTAFLATVLDNISLAPA